MQIRDDKSQWQSNSRCYTVNGNKRQQSRSTIMPQARTRRRFLQEAGALTATSPLAAVVQAADPAPKRTERLRVAIIGIAGQGAYNMAEVNNTKLVDIVALCDVDENRAAAARKQFP